MLAGIRLFVIPTLAVFLAGRAVRRNPSLQSKQSVAKYVGDGKGWLKLEVVQIVALSTF